MKKIIIIAILATFIINIGVFAKEYTGNEILKIIDKKLAPPNNEMYRKIINIESSGKKKEYTLYSATKDDDKIFSAFLEPASEKGRTTLRLGENMWMYLPSLKKPIRIANLQSVIGGLFNNSDIFKVDFNIEYDAAIINDNEEIKGEKYYILELKAKVKDVAYDKIKMWVKKDSLIPTKYEAYTFSGMLVKTIELTEIKDFGNGIVRPAKITTTTPLDKGAKSEMIYLKINPKEFPDEMFTLNSMDKAKIK